MHLTTALRNLNKSYLIESNEKNITSKKGKGHNKLDPIDSHISMSSL